MPEACLPTVARLSNAHLEDLEALLWQDRVLNLFLIGFVDEHPVDRVFWYGIFHGSTLTGALMLLPDRLVVSFIPNVEDALAAAETISALHKPCLMVGPRAETDVLWNRWAQAEAFDRYYNQRLYVATQPPDHEAVKGFGRADPAQWRAIAINSGKMEGEDLGVNRHLDEPQLHEHAVRERIRAGRTWVITEQDEIVFQINVGTQTPWGAQVGGTYVPPEHRGRGLATMGMAALLQAQLRYRDMVTLHVNEANAPAVRVYEKVGFVRSAPMRLITVPIST
jgi:uncharacterized protein